MSTAYSKQVNCLLDNANCLHNNVINLGPTLGCWAAYMTISTAYLATSTARSKQVNCFSDNASCLHDRGNCLLDNVNCLHGNANCFHDNVDCLLDNVGHGGSLAGSVPFLPKALGRNPPSPPPKENWQ